MPRSISQQYFKSMKKDSFILILFTALVSISFFSCRSVPPENSPAVSENIHAGSGDFIEINGINIHYTDTVKGKPELLMLHGFLGNLDNWTYITPLLKNDFRLVSYDRLAFGMSGRPAIAKNNPYTPFETEERALKLTEKLHMDKPVLVGHSAGGNLALRLALENTDSFSALILISPAIYNNGPPDFVRLLFKSGLFDKAGLNAIQKLPKRLDEFLKLAYHDPSAVAQETIDSYTAPLSLRNWDTALWEYTKAQNKNTIPERLNELKIPVLFIHGREDRVVPVEDSIKASAEIDGAVMVILNNCGHMAFEEKPGETASIVRAFLNELE